MCGEGLPPPTATSLNAMTNAFLIARRFQCQAIMSSIILALESYNGIPTVFLLLFEAARLSTNASSVDES
jgi:hypothetical protein